MGGSPAALNRFTYEQTDGEHTPPLISKTDNIKLRKGQRLRIESPGGGGYGPADERDPDAVGRDVQAGYVSPDAAERDYKVIVDASGEVNTAATDQLRRAGR